MTCRWLRSDHKPYILADSYGPKECFPASSQMIMASSMCLFREASDQQSETLVNS